MAQYMDFSTSVYLCVCPENLKKFGNPLSRDTNISIVTLYK